MMAAALSAGLDLGAFSQVQWYLVLGTAIAVIGAVRMLLTRDLVARLIALNVTGIGSLMIILALAARTDQSSSSGAQAPENDPVLSALVITGLVITVAFTGLGAVLIRRIEAPPRVEPEAESALDSIASPDAEEDEQP